jgi:predicted NACHT family NTPase
MGGDTPPSPFTPYRLQATLVGHAGSVASVKFSPDGRLLATACADTTARIWRVSDAQCVATLTGHTGGLSDVCWSAASDFVVTASDDKTCALWAVPSGERVLTYTGHTAFVFCCALNGASNILASGSFDETVRLWEARSGRCLAVLPAHNDPVTSVAFSHDGSLLVTSSYDGTCTNPPCVPLAWADEAHNSSQLAPRSRASLTLSVPPLCCRLGPPVGPCQRGVHEDPGPGRLPAGGLRTGEWGQSYRPYPFWVQF